MTDTITLEQLTQESRADAALDGDALFLKLPDFEGPIDLLLLMAREQKVDLAKISVLALAEQYLAFISEARALRLELAADYLVMAAWLAYLKSRLLLPQTPNNKEEPSAEALAEALSFQLKRLEAMQKASAALQALPQEGRGFVFRAARQQDLTRIVPVYYLGLYDLLKAVKAPLQRNQKGEFRITPTRLFSMEESVERMRKMLGYIPAWSELSVFLPDEWEDLTANDGAHETVLRSAYASTFAASLELVKQGQIELRQESNFGPVYLRPRAPTAEHTSYTE